MKYAIIIPDGAADEPQDGLGGLTPLQAAKLPHMDAVAAAGIVARANNTPADLPAGSDVANLSLLGYDPHRFYTGRAPLEAAAQGLELGPNDWAIRCNLVTVHDQVMKSYTAGQISTEEAAQLLRAAQDRLGGTQWQFYSGVSYRNLVIHRSGDEPSPFSPDTHTTPPHDLTDKRVIDDYPRGPGSDLLVELMNASEGVFADHPVNVARIAAGKPPATHVWLWGLGNKPKLAPFDQRFGIGGAMITAVDLLRGLAALLGWKRIEVPGATGYTDTDYAAKGRYAVEALREYDLVCVHVEAPDEASHEGDTEAKVKALEEIDAKIVAPVWKALQGYDQYRLLISPDHPTPLRTKTHSHGDVPAAIAGSDVQPDASTTYDEESAARSSLVFADGWTLMEYFIANSPNGRV